MGLSIVQVQGRLALTDDSGNVLGVFDDSGDKRIMVQALLKAGHGLSTEATLALIKAKTDNLDVALSTRAVTGLTDAELRATAVPVSVASQPLPTGAATEATLAAQTVADNAAFTNGTTQVTPAGFILDETAGAGLAENDAGAARITSLRQQVMSIEDHSVRGQRVAVKAGAAAAVAGDEALVVSVSPNSPAKVEGRAADGAAVTGNPVLIGGFDGTLAQTILTDDNGRIIVAPAGSSALATAGFAFGDVTLAAAGTQAVVRRTAYTEPSANAQRSVGSNNAADAAAGTGARQVKITYFTSAGVGPNTATVTLNGTTPVNTTETDICFIEKIEVISVGSSGSNTGTITLFASTAGGGGTVGTITALNNQTFWAHHYVASGKTCFITSSSASHNGTTVGSGGVFVIKAKLIGVATAVEVQVSDFLRQYGQAGNTPRPYGTPIEVVGPARIIGYCTPETGTSTVYRAAFDFYEQDT